MSPRKRFPKNPSSVEIWRGPSRIDGRPIVVIATGIRRPSQNRKTGAMIQTWILCQDVEPHDAIRNGSDVSICGDCPHRPDGEGKRSCYVRVADAPLTIHRAWKAGKYPRMSPAAFGALAARIGRKVRLGAYGDPGACPITVWKPIVSRAPGVTAYTHRWTSLSRAWAAFAMASTDSAPELFEARRRGFRSFRVTDDPLPGEMVCPSETRGLRCEDCGLCAGQMRAGAKDQTIPAHGAGAKIARAREAMV